MIVNRVERHIINKKHKIFHQVDNFSYISKNLYNYANYLIRQTFILTSKIEDNIEINQDQKEFINWINLKVDEFNDYKQENFNKKQLKGKLLDKDFKPLNYFNKDHKYLGYDFVEFLASKNENYNLLMAQVAQQTLRVLDKNWKSFFEGIKKWSKCKDSFTGKPKLPKYKKKNGRYNLYFTNQNCKIINGFIQFPKCFDKFKLKTNVRDNLQQVRIKPLGNQYVIEIVYQKNIEQTDFSSKNICGIDLGLNNFATLSNNVGTIPIIINGKGIKSINQFYNKQLALLKSDLKKRHNKDWSNKLQRLTNYRNNKIDDFIHKISKYIINYCIFQEIDTVVIGKNDKWKQKSKMSKKVNQQFIQIPHAKFINKLIYKCEDNKIKVILTEESYTSGTSFLDNELPIKENYNKTRRKFRGLFVSNNGIKINADVNGAYQIIKKVFPNVFTEGIEGVGLYPIRVNIA